MTLLLDVAKATRLAVLLLFVSACANQAPPDYLAPTKSPNDDYAYRLVTLDNGLKALLISDPDTPKAAASLDVRVGSGDNPRGRGGLAHFLEHMLFLGTEKYPDAAEYERYLTEHGGVRNAYTSFEHTNYYFDVDSDYLDGALDRFAQFFIAPSFDAQYVERERNAVQAEYQMGLTNDGRRGLDVLQTSMNPEHPFSQFAVGSLDSLADREGSSIRDELIEFYEHHYSADNMRLVVLGSESMDELESMTRAMFGDVPNRSVVMPPIEEALFVEAQLPMLLKVRPQGTLRQLQVNFQIPDYRDDYRAKPMAYISNLVGHEGEGSLLSSLKREGLADGLSSGTGLNWRGGSLFSVTVSLTEAGVADYERVLQQTFAYLDLLRAAKPQEWIYQEQSTLADLAFRFREQNAPVRYVSSLSNRMHYYEDNDVLRGSYLMEDFDEDAIAQALEYLVPEKVQVVLTAPEVTTDSESPYYDVAFERLGPEAIVLSRWRGEEVSGLQLPAANPFIAENVDLLPIADDNPALPTLRVDEPRKRIWYRQSEQFRVPRGAMFVSFRSPIVGATAEQRVSSRLYTRMVTDALNEYTYPALLAGLGFNFYRHSQGISMRVSGYNDKQLELLDELLREIAAQEFQEDRFERLRREMILDLQNTVARRPTSQLLADLRRSLVDGQFDEPELIAALEAMDLAALDAYRQEFWGSARAESMLFGNYAPDAVDRVSASLDRVIGGGAGEPGLAPNVVALKPGDSKLLESTIEHNDAVVAWYLQGAGQSYADRAMVSLTAQITESGFFQQLRTDQQLGYIVSSFSWPQYDVPALMLLIQSPSHTSAEVYEAMVQFLDDTLNDIDEAQFLRHRQALINQLRKPHENLGERAEFYWQSIALREWDFDSPDKMAEAVEAISFEQWQDAYQAQFLEGRRSLLALSAGQSEVVAEPVGAERFESPETLRQSNARYTVDLAPL